jgi:two-component system, OmpR family, response regulator
MKILMVEDDWALLQTIQHGLGEAYQVSTATSLAKAYQILEKESFQLIILDLHLPDGLSWELLRYIRTASYSTRILMLTKRNDEENRVNGLRSGADDYLAKPFSWEELRLRVHNLVSSYRTPPQQILRVGEMELRPMFGTVTERYGQNNRRLRPKETEVLACLLRHKNHVVTRKMVIEEVWATQPQPDTATIDVYVRRARRSLRGTSLLIETVRGFGFRVCDRE